MKDGRPYIVGLGGTTRPGSSTEQALRCALSAAQRHGATVDVFAGAELATLPMYAPEKPVRSEVAVRMVNALREADGVIIASPGYHGGISGLVKNALDYAEDLSKDDRPYLHGLPVGTIATGAGWQAIGSTLAALRTVAHAVRGWPTPLGAGVLTIGKAFGENGECLDESAAFQLNTIGRTVVEFAMRTIVPPQPAGAVPSGSQTA